MEQRKIYERLILRSHQCYSLYDEGKFEELAESAPNLKTYYQLQDNGFNKVNVGDDDKKN